MPFFHITADPPHQTQNMEQNERMSRLDAGTYLALDVAT
jgi:hypothetical protein